MKALTEYVALTCSLLVLTVSNAVGEEGGAVSKSAGLRVPAKFDLAGNADRLERAFREAKVGGARLVVAPEGSLEGYVVNEIIAVDRKEEGITYAEITLPPPVSASPKERDAQERRFLDWRENEMKQRYEKTMRKVRRAD